MRPRDILVALSVAAVWGLTFIPIRFGVAETSPLLLAAVRFFFASIPLVFFLPPPKAPAWTVALYGLLVGVAQFGLVYTAVGWGFPAGLASLVMQAQVLFTMALGWALLGERPRGAQILGGAIALAGLAIIGSERLAGASILPFMLVIAASFFWAASNVLARSLGKIDMLALTVWSCLVAPLPLLMLSLAVDGPRGIATLAHPSLGLLLAVLFLAYAGTVFGFGLWAKLLAKYSAATVAPFALLVPVVGMAAAAIILGEPLTAIEIGGGVVVMAGLAVNVLGDRLSRGGAERQPSSAALKE